MNRAMVTTLVAISLLLSVLSFIRAGKPHGASSAVWQETVECGALYIRGPSGKPLGGIEAVSDSEVVFLFRDHDGKMRLAAGVYHGKPRIVFLDATGKSRLSLGEMDDSSVTVSLFHIDGRRSTELYTKAGLASFDLYDGLGCGRAHFGTSSQGVDFTLAGSDEKPRASLAVESDAPMFGLSDKSGNVRLSAGMSETGPRIRISDERGATLFVTP